MEFMKPKSTKENGMSLTLSTTIAYSRTKKKFNQKRKNKKKNT